jgi:hypothetical protein
MSALIARFPRSADAQHVRDDSAVYFQNSTLPQSNWFYSLYCCFFLHCLYFGDESAA